MIERREFLKSLASLSAATVALPAAEESDRLGKLLPKRTLGRTGVAVTMLGVGGWHIGRMEEPEAQRTIEAALEGGIRFFDNAESYQDGASESRYGRLLTPKYRDIVFLMTKSTATDAATARRHLEESLLRMKTDYVDLWQMHSVTSVEDVDQRIQNGIL
ncbi:MAG: aldo/keto reductase, partial [Acidobacteria bacterium]